MGPGAVPGTLWVPGPPDVSPGPGTRTARTEPVGTRTLDQIGPLLTLDRLLRLLDLLDRFVFAPVLGWLRRLGGILWWDRGMWLGWRLLGLGWPGRLDLACTCDLAGGPGFRGDWVPP
jgi:hypothetical protein